MEFSKEYYLRTADFDSYECFTPRAILELFQDIASAHAEKIGVGFCDLLSKDLLWVIARTKFTVEKQVERFSTVKVKTWALKPQRLIFRREYLIFDTNGEIAVKGSADWMVIGRKTRALTTCGNIYPENAEYKEELALDERLKKIKAIDGDTTYFNVTPAFSDIDLNGHVNNTKYADFAINATNPEKPIKAFQIDYHKEVLLDEKLKLTAVSNTEKTVISGENLDGEKKFTCEIVF